MCTLFCWQLWCEKIEHKNKFNHFKVIEALNLKFSLSLCISSMAWQYRFQLMIKKQNYYFLKEAQIKDNKTKSSKIDHFFKKKKKNVSNKLNDYYTLIKILKHISLKRNSVDNIQFYRAL